MKIEYTHSGSTHLQHEYSMYRALEGTRKLLHSHYFTNNIYFPIFFIIFYSFSFIF